MAGSSIKNAKAVINAIKHAHPYEEPHVQVYPLLSEEDLPL